jgi:hypothetical protein
MLFSLLRLSAERLFMVGEVADAGAGRRQLRPSPLRRMVATLAFGLLLAAVEERLVPAALLPRLGLPARTEIASRRDRVAAEAARPRRRIRLEPLVAREEPAAEAEAAAGPVPTQAAAEAAGSVDVGKSASSRGKC